MPNLPTNMLEHFIPVPSRSLHETACNAVMKVNDQPVENMVDDGAKRQVADLLENLMDDSSEYVTLRYANKCNTDSLIESAQHDEIDWIALTMSNVTSRCHDIAKRLTDSQLIQTTTESSSY